MYRIVVYDNFHHMGDGESYTLKEEFPTLEAALSRARGIVEDSCRNFNYDFAQQCMFGDEPVIVGPQEKRWSAREYAKDLCERFGPKGS